SARRAEGRNTTIAKDHYPPGDAGVHCIPGIPRARPPLWLVACAAICLDCWRYTDCVGVPVHLLRDQREQLRRFDDSSRGGPKSHINGAICFGATSDVCRRAFPDPRSAARARFVVRAAWNLWLCAPAHLAAFG